MKGKNKSTVEHTEKDIIDFLKESKNHMVIVLGQKINYCNRNDIIANSKKREFQYCDKTGNKYYQVFGRQLVNEKDMNLITNPKNSIFNVSTLKDVVKMKNLPDSPFHPRSYYEVEAYRVEDYMSMID